jgi:hypothetical protein
MMRKGFITIGSIISIGFGIWHFFIPSVWNWYSYIDPLATELIIAIRAINIFFSLLLVLLGIANIIVVFRVRYDRFTYLVLISISVILWATRVLLQIIHPQSSQNPILQYCMLSIFIFVLSCYSIGIFYIIKRNENIL